MKYPNLECEHIITEKDIHDDVVLWFCNHPNNSDQTEGNCYEKVCSIVPTEDERVVAFIKMIMKKRNR
jgi:hypothetical protein